MTRFVYTVALKGGGSSGNIWHFSNALSTLPRAMPSARLRRRTSASVFCLARVFTTIGTRRRVITTLGRVITTRARVFTTRRRVITTRARVFTTRRRVITTRGRVITTRGRVITTLERVIGTRARVFTTLGRVFTTRSLSRTNIVRASPSRLHQFSYLRINTEIKSKK
jgi:hypothetical protein